MLSAPGSENSAVQGGSLGPWERLFATLCEVTRAFGESIGHVTLFTLITLLTKTRSYYF